MSTRARKQIETNSHEANNAGQWQCCMYIESSMSGCERRGKQPRPTPSSADPRGLFGRHLGGKTRR